MGNDNAGGTSALKLLIQILIIFAAGKCNDLSSHIGTELLLARAVLDHNVCSDLAVLKSHKLDRHNIGSLMEQLVEGMLSVCSGLAEEDRACDIVYRLTKPVHGLSVRLHVCLLQMRREAA